MSASQLLPPAQPTYVLRGHRAQVHSLCFIRANTRLLTGDADGWVVVWSVATKRPAVVWKPHNGSILGLAEWKDGRIITHGRDGKLNVWELRPGFEGDFSSVLPVDDDQSHRKEPWLLHSLHVNTLNFCSFHFCKTPGFLLHRPATAVDDGAQGGTEGRDDILLAVPGTTDSQVDIFSMPSERRTTSALPPPDIKTGMVMSVRLLPHPSQPALLVLVGYESGHTCIHRCTPSSAANSESTVPAWRTIYTSNSHTQPILSLDVAPSLGCYYTSSADSIIAEHLLFFTIPSSSAEATNEGAPADDDVQRTLLQQPSRTTQTKHSGQQSLAVRSDGKIFATAGWDARVRVYSTKTLSELAVLKWHKEGCYAVAFAEVGLAAADGEGADGQQAALKELSDTRDSAAVAMTSPIKSITTVKQRREAKAQTTHWLAAGSKDGKVTLWDIY